MTRDGYGASRAHKLADKVEHEIDARGVAGGGIDICVMHIKAIFKDLRLRRETREAWAIEIVRGAMAAIEESRAAEKQRTRTDCDKRMSGADVGPKPFNDGDLIPAVRFIICRAAPFGCDVNTLPTVMTMASLGRDEGSGST